MEKKLHPGARWIFRFKFYFTIGLIILVLFSLLVSYLALPTFIEENSILIFFILLISISEICIRAHYNGFSYDFTSKELIIKKGFGRKIKVIDYKDITNVYVLDGLIPKFFGFSYLVINTHSARKFMKRHIFFPRPINKALGIYFYYHFDAYLLVSLDEAESIQRFLLENQINY